MTTADGDVDQSWGQLVTAGAEERETTMAETYAELAALPEEERRRRLQAMARAEYALPEDQLREFTISRLRVWLRLEPDVAQRIASSYDAAMSGLPGPMAMRRVGIVQTLAKEFPAEDEERLRELVPAVFAGQPHRVVAGHAPSAAPSAPAAASASAAPAPEKSKRPWWAFWKR